MGLVTSITAIFPPSDGSAEHRHQIHITDGQYGQSHHFSISHCYFSIQTVVFLFRSPAVGTFWGKLAYVLDAEWPQRWSTDKPVVILFVGMSVNEFNGKHLPSAHVCPV